MLSQKLRTFFIPIFRKHKKIFLLLFVDGFITWILSVVTPVLLKFETDQLMEKKSMVTFLWELNGFQVFIGILLIMLLSEIISRFVSRMSEIILEAEKDYLKNHIQLELFKHMNEMEVWRAMNSRFKNLTRVLENEFSEFPNTIMNLPRDIIQKTIQITGITAIFIYFDIKFLIIVIISSVISYFIERYADILRQKYEIHWKFSLGQKVWFYNDLFLRSFPQLATNGAIKSTLESYQSLLDEQIHRGLKKNWAELIWTVSRLFTGSISQMLIKMIVGYSVFEWTQSIGMVALVVSSMGTVEEIMARILTLRKEYLRFRFQESSILLFLEMCEPIGKIQKSQNEIETIQFNNLSFSYPNLKTYEKQYMEIVENFMKWWTTWSKWIDDAFEDMVKSISEDMERKMPVVLQNVSLTLEKWKIYGVVWKNGAGKTTLMQLLSWFFRSYSGNIYFNNEDVVDWNPELFANKISFLTQEPFFMGYGSTIRQNLLLGVWNIKDEEIWNYLEKFSLADKIKKSPDGLESEIGEKIDFSWWEKQILTFIRLLLQDRPIIILDEWTNQLDAENEIVVMNELLKQKDDKIIIFITHRMSTISKADWIYCLEWCTISASWSHKSLLLEWNNAYARFYKAQVMHENVV